MRFRSGVVRIARGPHKSCVKVAFGRREGNMRGVAESERQPPRRDALAGAVWILQRSGSAQ
jgi:hypothetical protein